MQKRGILFYSLKHFILFILLSCFQNMWGPNCDQECTCDKTNGICKRGPKGDGKCERCMGKFIGQNCTIPCPCVNGECDDGPDGSGNCKGTNCIGNFFGEFCDKNGFFFVIFLMSITTFQYT